MTFFSGTESVFNEEFMKIRFEAVPIYRYLARHEGKQAQLAEQSIVEESGLKYSDLEDELKVLPSSKALQSSTMTLFGNCKHWHK